MSVSDSTFVLSSRSPRRRRLLKWLDIPFTSTEVDVDEDVSKFPGSSPQKITAHIAEEKARATRERCGDDPVILCFDTLVVLDGEILGKPKDEADARAMLARLSGRTHQVVTGMAIWMAGDPEPLFGTVTTDVVMHELTDEEVEAWLARGEYMGCAGAYNIEAQIASVDDNSCFQNVAGLPLCHLYRALRNRHPYGTSMTSPCATCNTELNRTCLLGPRVINAGTTDGLSYAPTV